jgi:hypothetical protein
MCLVTDSGPVLSSMEAELRERAMKLARSNPAAYVPPLGDRIMLSLTPVTASSSPRCRSAVGQPCRCCVVSRLSLPSASQAGHLRVESESAFQLQRQCPQLMSRDIMSAGPVKRSCRRRRCGWRQPCSASRFARAFSSDPPAMMSNPNRLQFQSL